MGAGLQFQRVSALSPWQEALQRAGTPGAGEGAESLASESPGVRKRERGSEFGMGFLESSKATPSDTLPPKRPQLLILSDSATHL